MPSSWNRSKATALATALLLHLGLASWLLSLRFGQPTAVEQTLSFEWLSPPPEPVKPPPPQPMPLSPGAVETPQIVLPALEEESQAITLPDWLEQGRQVASAFGRTPERRGFGEAPRAPPQLKSRRPSPSVFERPLPRVGTTVRSPEGESILWVSDNCYISLDSQSLTMGDFHAARRGVRRCNIGIGKKKPRDDLFAPIKRPEKGSHPFTEDDKGMRPLSPQEPGCRREEGSAGCAP